MIDWKLLPLSYNTDYNNGNNNAINIIWEYVIRIEVQIPKFKFDVVENCTTVMVDLVVRVSSTSIWYKTIC